MKPDLFWLLCTVYMFNQILYDKTEDVGKQYEV
jgi:hypothetical protein